jgi:multicomponent Na+:H+ antiporter subunit D
MTISSVAHPGLLLIVVGPLLPVLRGPVRAATALLVPAAALLLAWNTPDGALWSGHLFGYEVLPFQADKLSRLFAIIFSLMAFGGALFALNQSNRLELPAAFVYAGSAIGVVFAGDLLTVFAYWETMAIGSTLVLWSAGTATAYRASMRYIMVHLLGGTLLLMGVAGHAAEAQSLRFGAMQADSASHWLILAAFLVNAGAPPLSAWLADAYPESSMPARRRCRRGWRMPIPKAPGAAWCSCPRSPPRRRCTCCCAASPAPSCWSMPACS